MARVGNSEIVASIFRRIADKQSIRNAIIDTQQVKHVDVPDLETSIRKILALQ